MRERWEVLNAIAVADTRESEARLELALSKLKDLCVITHEQAKTIPIRPIQTPGFN